MSAEHTEFYDAFVFAKNTLCKTLEYPSELFDGANLCLVYNQDSLPESFPWDVKRIEEYAFYELLAPEAPTHTKGMGWDLLMGKGGYLYIPSKKTIYIRYPYLPQADMPLKRAVLHELGHYAQYTNAENQNIDITREVNELILETHNIIFHENSVNDPIGSRFLYTAAGYRFTYNNSQKDISTPLPEWAWNSTKKTLHEIANKENLGDFDRFLLKEMSNLMDCFLLADIKNEYAKSLISLLRDMLIKIA